MRITVLGYPKLLPVGESNHYKLLEDLTFSFHGMEVTVPKGYLTDGASIPRFAWYFVGSPFEPRHMLGAIIHDWLYSQRIADQKVADAVFLQILKEQGKRPVPALVMWLTLRIFGWMWWRK